MERAQNAILAVTHGRGSRDRSADDLNALQADLDARDAETIAKTYCKTKKLILGLLRLNGGSQFTYSLKFNGQWRLQGTITDTRSYEIIMLTDKHK